MQHLRTPPRSKVGNACNSLQISTSQPKLEGRGGVPGRDHPVDLAIFSAQSVQQLLRMPEARLGCNNTETLVPGASSGKSTAKAPGPPSSLKYRNVSLSYCIGQFCVPSQAFPGSWTQHAHPLQGPTLRPASTCSNRRQRRRAKC